MYVHTHIYTHTTDTQHATELLPPIPPLSWPRTQIIRDARTNGNNIITCSDQSFVMRNILRTDLHNINVYVMC